VTVKAAGALPGRWDASLTWAVLAIAIFAVFFFVSGRQ